MAAQSPGMVLLDTGANYLARPVSDNIFSVSAAHLSVCVTFDPTILGAGYDGVITSKHNAAGNQRSWTVSYAAATGLVTVALWSSLTNASPDCSRVVAAGVFVRSTLIFAYDGAATTLNLYVNGSLSNGTLTGTVPATLANSSEPLAVGCSAPSGTPQNVWRGAVYHFVVWNSTLSSGDVGTVLRDGVTPSPLKGGTYNLQLNCEHTSIEQDFADKVQKWRELNGLFRNLFGYATSGTLPRAQMYGLQSLLIQDQWDYTLADSGFLAQALSSTFTNAPPWRLYASALSAPSRASFRAKRNDITIWVRARRQVGSATTVFIDLLGLHLQYTLSGTELFCIVGDDTSNTLQNTKASFGTAGWAALLDGLFANIVLRYNSVDKTVDCFVNGTKFTPTNTTTNTSATATTLTLAQTADFELCEVVPACLSDAQVAQLLEGNPIPAYRALLQRVQGVPEQYAYQEQTADPLVDPATEAVNPVVITSQAKILKGRGVDAPYVPVEALGRQFLDPQAVAVSVTADSSHIVSATATAGPTDAVPTVSWWEINLDGTTRVLTPPRSSSDFFLGRVTATTGFPVPSGENWNGRQIRFVIQAASDASQVWHSGYLTMSGLNFDNDPFAAPAYNDPLPAITSVTADSSHTVTMVGALGDVSADTVPRPGIVYWWEIEVTAGVFYAAIDERTLSSVPTRQTLTDAFVVPVGLDLRGKRIRLSARSLYDYTAVWHSAYQTMSGANFFNPAITIPSYADPNLVISDVSADDTHHAVVIGSLGPVTSDLIAHPALVYWWEVELTTGVFYAVIDETTLATTPSRVTRTDAFDVPSGLNLRGRQIRLAARSIYDYTQVWRSSPVTMTDLGFDNGIGSGTPLPPGPPLGPPRGPTRGLHGPGVYRVPVLDRSGRR